jgi:hypothetical protein
MIDHKKRKTQKEAVIEKLKVFFERFGNINDGSKATRPLSLFVLITTLIQPMQELNINALRTFMILTLGRHHEFKEI